MINMGAKRMSGETAAGGEAGRAGSYPITRS
jgi:hypothetical protein